MFRDVKNSLKMGHYFDFSRRKLSGGTSNFKKIKDKSTNIHKANHLKFWSSNRSESNEALRRPKSNRNGYKTPFSPTRKLQVVSARKVKFCKKIENLIFLIFFTKLFFCIFLC